MPWCSVQLSLSKGACRLGSSGDTQPNQQGHAGPTVPQGKDIMNTQHTPGPWKITSLEFIDDSLGGGIARVYSRQTRSLEELEANARLIAAAPEMLEALKDQEKFWVMREAELGLLSTKANELLARIRAAIAKAEGR